VRRHQLDAVARCISGNNTLLAHVVGAGKTYTMIAAAHEQLRLGLAGKVMFAVPNHLTEQFGSDIYELYPDAKVLISTKADFETSNRQKFLSRIAMSDVQYVVIGHSQFEKIQMSPKTSGGKLNGRWRKSRSPLRTQSGSAANGIPSNSSSPSNFRWKHR
jgi:N12 class adenine-specific DNA methylase